MKRIVKGVAYVCGGVSLFYGLFPLVHKSFHAGCVGLVAFGTLTTLTTALWDSFDGKGRIARRLHQVGERPRDTTPRWWRRMRAGLAVCLTLAAAGGAVLSTMMLAAAAREPREPSTVVVLGCQIKGDQPSLMLQWRLEEALEYLRQNPQAPVVCTGGVGTGERYSEAEVMRRYLERSGIDAQRIYVEEASSSTKENISFSAKLIAEENLPRSVAVASDRFHQLRAHYYARQNGLEGASLATQTPWGIAPSYWVREWFAICKMWVLDR